MRAIAQNGAPQPNLLYLAGTVLNDGDGHPLKKVLIQAVAEDGRQDANYSANADADGHFRIDDIAPGRYRVFLEKAGFTGASARAQRGDGVVITVSAGKPPDDLIFHMVPAAVIAGRVTDEDGEPMPNIRIIIQRKIPGKAKRATVSAVATNDIGEYRTAGLSPGQYWIAAMPPPDARDYDRPHPKPPAAEEQPETRYVTTYYPGTTDSAEASSIMLKAGDEVPVNLTLVPSRTYRIRGLVTSLVSGQNTSIELTSKTGDSIAGAEVAADGTFEIHGAAAGSYVLRAYSTGQASVLTARQDVIVVAADIDGLKIVPLAAFTVSGHLRADSEAAIDLSQYTVNLRQADVSEDAAYFIVEDSFGENAQVDRQGNFTWNHVNPGNYIVRLFGARGRDNTFLKSARLGATNAEGAFAIHGPGVLDLVIGTRGATVEGQATDHDQQGNDVPVPNVTVVAVPDEKYRKVPERFGVGSTDQSGHFTIRGLAPGAYTLFAWQDVDDAVYRDPDFLKSQESNGVAVRLDEGSRKAVNLKLSPIGDEWK
jgi:protocatechuate 3,4-dioxygenase beta subunit